jgi:hypothetical protein
MRSIKIGVFGIARTLFGTPSSIAEHLLAARHSHVDEFALQIFGCHLRKGHRQNARWCDATFEKPGDTSLERERFARAWSRQHPDVPRIVSRDLISG